MSDMSHDSWKILKDPKSGCHIYPPPRFLSSMLKCVSPETEKQGRPEIQTPWVALSVVGLRHHPSITGANRVQAFGWKQLRPWKRTIEHLEAGKVGDRCFRFSFLMFWSNKKFMNILIFVSFTVSFRADASECLSRVWQRSWKRRLAARRHYFCSEPSSISSSSWFWRNGLWYTTVIDLAPVVQQDKVPKPPKR